MTSRALAERTPKFWTPIALDGVADDPHVTLCQLNWDLYHEAPYKYPMFKDLTTMSKCKGSNLQTRLLSELWREYEQNADGYNHVQPTAFVFHESRVGSTLVANTFGSSKEALVFSESGPPVTCLLRCRTCTAEQNKDRFRKLILLMGASPVHKYLFFKFQSISTTEMKKALGYFPSVPWAFIFRQPVQTIMSHLDKKKGGSGPCLRYRSRPYPEARAAIEQWIDKDTPVVKASKEAACAGHLNMLCLRALSAYDKHALNTDKSTPRGMLINYEALPGAVPRLFLPQLAGVLPNHEWMANIAVNTKFYSKASVARRSKSLSTTHWKGDSKDKDARATDMMRKWTDRIMTKSYYKMNNHSAQLASRVASKDMRRELNIHNGVGFAEAVYWKHLASMEEYE